MRSLGALIRRLTEQNADHVFLDLPGRVAKTLVRLAGDSQAPMITIELNQSQLAEMAGGSRQSVNQAIGSFATRGWLRTEGRRIVVTDLTALRKQLNEQLEEQGSKLSVNDFVMKACAVALKDYPKLNALWTDRGIELHQQVNLAMAVALEAGLITPVIKDAANKTLSAISASSKDLAKRAREGGLNPDEYQGGTFTVSNMGMFGVESFSAIINPPQAAIVAVSTIVQRAVFKDEEVIPVSLMKLTLSADHRISNGAEGGQYLAEVKRLLEHPMTLVV